MDNITTVIIYYSVKNRITYQKFAEFFRLAGIYVWEQCDVYRKDSQNETEDASIEREDTLICSIDSLVSKSGDHVKSWDDWTALLALFMEENKDRLQDTELEEALLVLKEIYTNDLFVAATTVQYYRMRDSLVSKTGEMFRQVINNIQTELSADSRLESNRYVRYALLYCYQKANRARRLCDEPVEELVDVLAEWCLQLALEYPDFSNAWVLLGKIYEFSKGKMREVMEVYERALDKVGEYPYASSIYYWIGKHCEGYPNRQDLLQEVYGKAYRLEPKYRNVYKMAMIEEQKHEWEKGNCYFKQCVDLINRKGNDLDPLEQEYIYKVSIKIGYNYLKNLKQPYESIYWFEQAKSFRDKIFENQTAENPFTRFYFDLYGEDAKQYIALELKRMGTNQLFVYMVEAYRQSNQTEKEMQYRELLQSAKKE